MDCIKGILITKREGREEIPFAVDIDDKVKSLNEETLYTAGVNIYGKIKKDTEYLYLIYYIADPGGFTPNCVYINEKDADRHLNYWNDDAGIMATGHYFLKEKVKILK